MSNISNDKVDCIAPLCSSTVSHLYHLPYNRSSAQQHTIDCIKRRKSLFPNLASSCLYHLQSELICNGLGDEVVGGAQVIEC